MQLKKETSVKLFARPLNLELEARGDLGTIEITEKKPIDFSRVMALLTASVSLVRDVVSLALCVPLVKAVLLLRCSSLVGVCIQLQQIQLTLRTLFTS